MEKEKYLFAFEFPVFTAIAEGTGVVGLLSVDGKFWGPMFFLDRRFLKKCMDKHPHTSQKDVRVGTINRIGEVRELLGCLSARHFVFIWPHGKGTCEQWTNLDELILTDESSGLN